MIAAADGLSKAKLKLYQVNSAEEQAAAATILEARKIDLQEARNMLLETQVEQQNPEALAQIDLQSKVDEQNKLLELVDTDIKNGIPKAEAYQRRGLTYTAPTDQLAEWNAAVAQAEVGLLAEGLITDEMVGGSPLGDTKQGPSVVTKQGRTPEETVLIRQRAAEILGRSPRTQTLTDSEKAQTERTDRIRNAAERFGINIPETDESGVEIDPDKWIRENVEEESKRNQIYDLSFEMEHARRRGLTPDEEVELAGDKELAEERAKITAATEWQATLQSEHPNITIGEALLVKQGKPIPKLFEDKLKETLPIIKANIPNATKADQFYAAVQAAGYRITPPPTTVADEYQQIHIAATELIEKYPGEFQGLTPGDFVAAYAKVDELAEQRRSAVNAGKYITNVDQIFAEYRDRKRFQKIPDDRRNEVIAASANRGVEGLVSHVTAYLWRTGRAKDRRGVERIVRDIVNKSLQDTTTPDPYRILKLAESALTEVRTIPGVQSSEIFAADSSLTRLESRMLEMEGLMVEYIKTPEDEIKQRQDLRRGLDLFFGSEADKLISELNTRLEIGRIEYQFDKSGKAVTRHEMNIFKAIMPDIKATEANNLARVRGWLKEINLGRKALYQRALGDEFEDLLPSHLKIGDVDPENPQEYPFTYVTGGDNDPALQSAYQEMSGGKPEEVVTEKWTPEQMETEVGDYVGAINGYVGDKQEVFDQIKSHIMSQSIDANDKEQLLMKIAEQVGIEYTP